MNVHEYLKRSIVAITLCCAGVMYGMQNILTDAEIQQYLHFVKNYRGERQKKRDMRNTLNSRKLGVARDTSNNQKK
jgi:hypothetical protein